MFFLLTSLLAFADETFHAEIDLYERSHRWRAVPTIYVCRGHDIRIADVKVGRNFWDDIFEKDMLGSIQWTSSCKKPKKNSILIRRGETDPDEYAYEVTWKKKGTQKPTKSLIVIGEDVQKKKFLQFIIAHELGHSIGIKHCIDCDEDDLMQE